MNCVLAMISWGYTYENSSWIYHFLPLGYKDTLKMTYYILVMKNIAIWPYKENAFWPYYVVLHVIRYPKTHLLELNHPYVLEK
jgi:hypothetical protein